MSDRITITRELVLDIVRCWDCGRWWGCEERSGLSRCPRCAGKRIAEVIEDQEKLERTVRALKGAITRLKGKR